MRDVVRLRVGVTTGVTLQRRDVLASRTDHRGGRLEWNIEAFAGLDLVGAMWTVDNLVSLRALD